MSHSGLPNVLLLGISYPDVQGHMREHGYSDDLLIHTEPSVEQAVECVRRGVLTEMDARDLARCIATEQCGDGLRVYTVSKEVGGVYRQDRHIYANFNNSRGFCNKLIDSFGRGIQFQQVVLDYYWMPTGWLVTRWAKSLFQNTLPDLVRHNLLAYPGTRSRRQNRGSSGDGNAACRSTLEEGVVFLPFCAHVCKELVGAIHILSKYYAITFVKKDELLGHSLWKGTMDIDGDVMQHRLGKRLDQEEVYCTFQPKDIYESMEDFHIKKDDVMKMLLSIDDFENIRMIRLRPLRQHEPPSVFKERLWEPEVGGFVDLDMSKGARLFKEFRSRKKAPPPPKAVRSTPTTEDETVSESQSDSDSSSSEEESEDDGEAVSETEMLEFDPDDPNGIPEVTKYYPYPALDLKSYLDAKDIMKDDHVMNSWAETWGPKAGRKKNRVQDILENSYDDFRRQHKGFMTSSSRLPDPESLQKDGYHWTLAADGWELSLVGDAPGAIYERDIVELANRNFIDDGSRLLLEIRNPGMKSYSRIWVKENLLSCYQIPRTTILFKIESARAAEKVLLAKELGEKRHKMSAADGLLIFHKILQATNPKEDEIITPILFKIESARAAKKVLIAKELGEKCDKMSAADQLLKFHKLLQTTNPKEEEITPIEKLSITNVYKMDINSLLRHLEAYEHQDIRKTKIEMQRQLVNHIKENENGREDTARRSGVDDSEDGDNDSWSIDDKEMKGRSIFNQCAAFVSTRAAPSDECEGVREVVIEESLPPFRPRLMKRYLQFDLGGRENFVEELYRLLEGAENLLIAHIIAWQKGKSFKVFDEKAFEEKVLADCCVKMDASFNRFKANLFRFGFSEVEKGTRRGGFQHESFRRGKPNQVSLIRRSLCMVSDEQRKPTVEGRYHLGCSRLFPYHLYGLLADAKNLGFSSIISWQEGGKSFRVHDRDLFSTKLLQHCSRTKFKQFMHTLLHFGFTRIVQYQYTYEHPNFRENEPWKLQKIEHGVNARTFNVFYNLAEKESFLCHLHQLLEDTKEKCWGRVISWLADGKSFGVHDPEMFELMVLQIFSNVNYKRFAKYLKEFGFEEMGKRENAGAWYKHASFERGFWDVLEPKFSVRGSKTKVTKQNSRRKECKPQEPASQDYIDLDTFCTYQRNESASPSNKRQRIEPKMTTTYDLKASPEFPRNLYALLEKADSDSRSFFVRWLPDGRSFVVTNRDMFTERFLLRGNKGARFNSFEVTLLNFGFEKIETRCNSHYRYGHPHFTRGSPHKLWLLELQIASIKHGCKVSNSDVDEANRPVSLIQKPVTPTTMATSRKRKCSISPRLKYERSCKPVISFSSNPKNESSGSDPKKFKNASSDYSGETKSNVNGPTEFSESITFNDDNHSSLRHQLCFSHRGQNNVGTRTIRCTRDKLVEPRQVLFASTAAVDKNFIANTGGRKDLQGDDYLLLTMDELYKVATKAPPSLEEVFKAATADPCSASNVEKSLV